MSAGPFEKEKVRPLVYESDLSEEQARLVITSGEKENPGPDISERIAARERVERLLEGLDERDRLMLILKEVEGFFDRGNRGSAESEWQYGESEALSGPGDGW